MCFHVVPCSSRVSAAHALSGFGRFRRICLFDTLLPLMSEASPMRVKPLNHFKLAARCSSCACAWQANATSASVSASVSSNVKHVFMMFFRYFSIFFCQGEILAVLGHEIGHDRLYHVHTMLLIRTERWAKTVHEAEGPEKSSGAISARNLQKTEIWNMQKCENKHTD